MSYRVIIKPSAEKQLSDLPRAIQKRVILRLSKIESDPRAGAVKLAGIRDTYRTRIGDYRIVYEIDDYADTIFITLIAHRREVYRGL